MGVASPTLRDTLTVCLAWLQRPFFVAKLEPNFWPSSLCNPLLNEHIPEYIQSDSSRSGIGVNAPASQHTKPERTWKPRTRRTEPAPHGEVRTKTDNGRQAGITSSKWTERYHASVPTLGLVGRACYVVRWRASTCMVLASQSTLYSNINEGKLLSMLTR